MDGLKSILEALATGGPTAMASIFAIIWYLERKENRRLQKELLDLAVAQVQTNTKIESTMSALKDIATQALNRY